MKKIITLFTSFIITIMLVLTIMPTDIVKAEDGKTDCVVTIYYVNKSGKVATTTRNISVAEQSDISSTIQTWSEPIQDAYDGTTSKYSYIVDSSTLNDLTQAKAMYGDWTVDEKYIVAVSAAVDTEIDGYYNLYNDMYYKVYAFVNGDAIDLPETGKNGNQISWKVSEYAWSWVMEPTINELIVPGNFAEILKENIPDYQTLQLCNTIGVEGLEVIPTEPTEPSNPTEPTNPEPTNPTQPTNPDTADSSTSTGATDTDTTPATSYTPAGSDNGTAATDMTSASSSEAVTTVVSETEKIVKTSDGKEIRTITTPNNGNVTVAGDTTVIPTGASFEWYGCEKDSANYVMALEAIRNSSVVKTSNISVVNFDLTDNSGAAIHELGGYVDVTMPLGNAYDHALSIGRTISVYRLEEDGTLTKCESEIVTNPDGTKNIVFKTNHFSTYIFTEENVVTSPKTGEAPIALAGMFAIIISGIAGILFVRKKKIF